MLKKDADILQIRKYLNGELNAKAMHQLERRAQSDPFLMDALEGYESVPGNQQANLNELSDRLKRRISNRGARIITWKYLAAAASILVVLTVGGLLLYNRQPENKQRTADIATTRENADTTTPEKPAAEKSKIKAPTIPPEQQPTISSDAVVKLKPPIVSNDMPVDKPVKKASMDSVVQYPAAAESNAPPKIAAGSVAVTTPQNISRQDDVTRQADKAIQGRAAGIIADNFLKTARKRTEPKNVVTGRVIERNSGLPLSGATIMVAGTRVAAVTNVDGYFSIPVDTSKDKLFIAEVGYQSRQVSARNRDSLASIKLKPDDKSLAEVVVVGYGTNKKSDDEADVKGAHPTSGWGEFDKYLKKNAVLPDGSTGVVKLSFQVASTGAVINIKVEKSLNAVADQKAVDLINNGPYWIGNTNGQAEKVTVKVKFVKNK